MVIEPIENGEIADVGALKIEALEDEAKAQKALMEHLRGVASDDLPP